MINVIIYLKKEHNPKELVKFLLIEKLISSASIDQNNISYKLVNDKLTEDVYSVITAQSKTTLFKDIVTAVEKELGKGIAINSTPIVGTSGFFNEDIEQKTT